jgi:hypothetical protein
MSEMKTSQKKATDTTFKFRCNQADLEAFRKAAKAEGFANVSAWILWNLRRIVR